MKLKTLLKGSVPVIKYAVMLMAFQVIISLFSVVLLGLAEEQKTISLLLLILFYASLIAFLFVISSTAAYTDYNMRKNNALRIKNKETVEPYKLLQEYRWYKGYLAGFLSMIPLILFVIIGLFTSGTTVLDALAMILYSIYYTPLYLLFGWQFITPMLFSVVLVTAISGASYQLKGYKMYIQHLKLTHQLD